MDKKKIYIILLTVMLILVGSALGYFLLKDGKPIGNEDNRTGQQEEDYVEKEITEEYNEEWDPITGLVEEDEDLPSPDGYEWVLCANMEAQLLKPDGWYKVEETTDGTEVCFITKEEFEGDELFETGLSVNMIRNIELKAGMAPAEYAYTFINQLDETYSGGGISPVGDGVYFTGYSTALKIFEGSEPTNIIYMALASEDADKIYIFWYEGTDSEWEDSLPIGAMMLDNMILETE